MIRSCLKRPALPLAAVMALAPACAAAQEWQVFAGAASRAEYSDNYFFVPPSTGSPPTVGPESAFTLSLIPFVAAARRTEVSEVRALLSLGANKSWDVSEEYLSASVGLDGTWRDERSTWSGGANYSRSRELQNVISGGEVVRAPTDTDSVVLRGNFGRQLTEQWYGGTGFTASYNRYDGIQDATSATDDTSFSASGDLRYWHSDATRTAFSLAYVYSTGELTNDGIFTARAGVAHRVSPQLTIAASAGWFWSDTRLRSGAPEPIASVGREDGGLFGASVEYAFSEASRLAATASQNLEPSGVGTVSKSDNATLALTHRFSDYLQGHIGAGYTRTTFPQALDESYSDKSVQAEVGLTWRFAERWSLDAGYSYERTRYSNQSGEPRANRVFVGVAYNWPGTSLSGWIGSAGDARALAGTGPFLSRDFAVPGVAPTPVVPEPGLFDSFSLP